MKRIGLFAFVFTVVGLITYAFMRFSGRTPSLDEKLTKAVSQTFENPHSNDLLIDTLMKASLMSKRWDDANVTNKMFDKISYNISCIQILEVIPDHGTIKSLIFSFMMKQKDLSQGYTKALDELRNAGKFNYINHTVRPDMALANCSTKLTDAEKKIYLQRWKDFVVKNRSLQSKL